MARGLQPTSVNRENVEVVGAPFRVGKWELSPHLPLCGLGGDLPPYQVAYPNPSSRLATIRERYRQDRTDSTIQYKYKFI